MKKLKHEHELDRKSTRLNSSHTVIYTLSLHDALPIFGKCFIATWARSADRVKVLLAHRRVGYEKTQARTRTIQSGVARRRSICRRPRRRRVRGDRFGKRQGAIRLPPAGARQ